MVKWNEQHLRELVRKMGLRRTRGQGKTPPHLSLYGPSWDPEPLLAKIMRLNATRWRALGYDETDRVSVVRYLGSLGYRINDALWAAAMFQQPLTPELAKSLIDAGAFDKSALRHTAIHQCPLTPDLAKFLIDTGCDAAEQDGAGWDALVFLAACNHPVDPQVTDLFLSYGCRTDLNRCKDISDKARLRFEQILEEHTQWKLDQESAPADSFCDVNWGR